MVREKLLTFGFGEALKLLQKYSLLDINHLISLADEVSQPTYEVTRAGNSVYVENTAKIEPVWIRNFIHSNSLLGKYLGCIDKFVSGWIE
jgi:hypothetical protein